MADIDENQLEQSAIGWFREMAWQTAFGPDISSDGPACEREDYDRVVLLGRLQTALENVNPNIPPDAIDEAVRKITRTDSPTLAYSGDSIPILVFASPFAPVTASNNQSWEIGIVSLELCLNY